MFFCPDIRDSCCSTPPKEKKVWDVPTWPVCVDHRVTLDSVEDPGRQLDFLRKLWLHVYRIGKECLVVVKCCLMSSDVSWHIRDNAEARFNNSLRPRKPEGSLGRTAQDVHLDSHTAPELCRMLIMFSFISVSTLLRLQINVVLHSSSPPLQQQLRMFCEA